MDVRLRASTTWLIALGGAALIAVAAVAAPGGSPATQNPLAEAGQVEQQAAAGAETRPAGDRGAEAVPEDSTEGTGKPNPLLRALLRHVLVRSTVAFNPPPPPPQPPPPPVPPPSPPPGPPPVPPPVPPPSPPPGPPPGPPPSPPPPPHNSPEPGTLVSALVGIGLAGLFAIQRRKRGQAGSGDGQPTGAA